MKRTDAHQAQMPQGRGSIRGWLRALRRHAGAVAVALLIGASAILTGAPGEAHAALASGQPASGGQPMARYLPCSPTANYASPVHPKTEICDPAQATVGKRPT